MPWQLFASMRCRDELAPGRDATQGQTLRPGRLGSGRVARERKARYGNALGFPREPHMLSGSKISPRRALIIAHDMVATAAAVVASFYIRFEAAGLAERSRGLLYVLPGVVVYSGIVYFLFHLYKAKWRFASLPDLMNIFRAVTVMAVSLLVLDYVLVAPNVLGTFFFGKITIVLYWVLQMAFLGGPRIAYRYFRYTRTRHRALEAHAIPTLVLGRAADAEVLLRAIESGAAAQDLARRHFVAIARGSRPDDPWHSGSRRFRRPRAHRC